MVHGYFIWFGDILFHYALMGMLIYPLHNLSPRILIVIASVLLSIGALLQFGGGKYKTQLQAQGIEIQQLQEAGEELTEQQ